MSNIPIIQPFGINLAYGFPAFLAPPGVNERRIKMPVYKDEERNTYYVKLYYTDYTGTKKQKLKRGFKLQREAKEWEHDFLIKQAAQPSMPFRTLCELYLEDKKEHSKASSYETKECRINNWILPYFADKPVDSITPSDIRKWQAELKNAVHSRNNKLSPGYLQILVTELSSVFHFAVRFFGLSANPCTVAGNMIGKKQKSLNFWIKEDFDKFIDTFEESDPYRVAYLTLYYTGMRIGELLALTPADIDFENNLISINKTYQVIKGAPMITTPKTERSIRSVALPPFLVAELHKHTQRFYDLQQDQRLFIHARRTYGNILKRHAEIAGVKCIRTHDLRHSHASLLIELGFSALLVSERLGHENVTTTLNVYSHLFPSKHSEVADKLELLYQKEKN